MDYVSFVGAIGGVIAAIYAVMAYYRMKADDCPALHIRFLESTKDGTYHLVLEIYPGKRPAIYNMISIKGGCISPAESVWKGDEKKIIATQDLRQSHEVNIHIPSEIARDFGTDLSLILSMKNKAVISLHTGKHWFSKKNKIVVMSNMKE